MTEQERACLEAAATAAERQMEQNPGVPIPVDPAVAKYMGAFVDDSMSLEEVIKSMLPLPEDDV